MRRLQKVNSPKNAARIVDRLLLEGIEATVRPEGGAEVWVLDDDDLDRARTLLATEHDEGAVTGKAAKLRRAQAREDQAHQQRHIPIKRRWLGDERLPLSALVLFLIVASVLVTAAAAMEEANRWVVAIDTWDSLRPLARVRDGEVWRLLTPMFLHFGVLHLLFNMAWVARLGPQIERNHGPVVFVTLVLTSALAGNLGQYVVSGPSFGGMSGVVYGLFGFVWMHARYARDLHYRMGERDVALGMVWLVLCATGVMGPIANIGHAGGLIVGLAFGVPAYVRHLRSDTTAVDLAEGSWGDVSLRGWRRFRRRLVDPYVPIWFLVVASALIWFEEPTLSLFTGERPEPCERYLARIEQCRPQVDPAAWEEIDGHRDAVLRVTNHGWGVPERESSGMACAETFSDFDAWLEELGCS